MRAAEITRNTTETQITLRLELDGAGKCECNTGVGFLDHMLALFARHGRFNLALSCTGDVLVDFHHTVEDVGITLGKAFSEALGDMRGIIRYGNFLMPMDETLVLVAIDISGRAHLSYDLRIPALKVGEFDTELVQEFFLGFARALGATIHMKQLEGNNSHHIIEGAFKGFARAMAQAVSIDAAHRNEIPSTKGLLRNS